MLRQHLLEIPTRVAGGMVRHLFWGAAHHDLPQGYSFDFTFRCNSRQFLIAKELRWDVLMTVGEEIPPSRSWFSCLNQQ